MKRIMLALGALLITAASVYALGGLTNTPPNIFPQNAIQQFTATGTFYKSLGTGGQAAFANISTTTLAALRPIGYTGGPAVPVAVAVKYRVGGFVTGRENDFNILPSTGGDIWVGPNVNKIGFKAISTATGAYISGAKF